MAPNASPANTPRAGAEAQALRSFMSTMPGGSIDFSRTNERQQHKNLDALKMMNFSSGSGADNAVDHSNVSAVQTYEATSTKLHHQSTLAWQNRSAKPGQATQSSLGSHHRSPMRGNRTVGGITKRSSSALGHSNSKAMDHSIHTADAACCGYRNVAEHQGHVKKCKGLFVTFCANSVEQQLANAQRELAVERESREGDYDNYRHELAALVHENARMKKEHAEMKEKVDTWDAVTKKNISEINVLKEEYERRWREELETNARLRTATSEAVEESERLKSEDGGKRYRIQELEAEVDNLKDVAKRSEDQAVDNAKRAQMLFDEREVIAKKAKNYELEITSLTETVRTKTSVIVGLEKEMSKANEKLSSISFFRESFAGKKKGGLQQGMSMSPLGSPLGSSAVNAARKEKLRQRYFGRL